MQRITAGRGIVLRHCGTRFERHAGDPADMEIALHDVIRCCESLVGGLAVAEPGFHRHVVGHFVPYSGRSRRHCVVGVQDERQFLVVDHDRLGGIHRLRLGFGDDHGHRLADMARLVGRQQHVRTDEHRSAARGVQLHVEFGLRQRIVRDRVELVGETIGAGEDAEHAGHLPGRFTVDAANARMRIGRAHHRGVSLPLELEVVAEAAPAGDEPLILRPPDWFSDETVGGLVHFFVP